jgi:glycosyltransferase involved in cell wall biosynthesis
LKLVIVNDTLLPGGAESFSLRLAVELVERGHEVFCYVLRKNKINRDFQSKLAPGLIIHTPSIPFMQIIEKIDGLLFVLRINFSLLQLVFSIKLRGWLKKIRPDVVHSNLFSADLIVAAAIKNEDYVFVNTIHGDYLRHYYNKLESIKAIRVLHFRKAFHEVLKRLDLIVCITEKQIAFAQEVFSDFGVSVAAKKIYNGYRMPEDVKPITREHLSIPKDAFIFGMVARGIKEKGWEELINAFEALSLENAYLILVGGGAFIEQMKATYTSSKIIYIGEVVNPLDYISLFDVGCLPSYSENLPTSIIEYIYCGKPVIATNAGEIPAMIDASGEKRCGMLIEPGTPYSMIDQLKMKILLLVENRNEWERLKKNTTDAKQKFNMDICVGNYEEVYIKMVNKHL